MNVVAVSSYVLVLELIQRGQLFWNANRKPYVIVEFLMTVTYVEDTQLHMGMMCLRLSAAQLKDYPSVG